MFVYFIDSIGIGPIKKKFSSHSKFTISIHGQSRIGSNEAYPQTFLNVLTVIKLKNQW